MEKLLTAVRAWASCEHPLEGRLEWKKEPWCAVCGALELQPKAWEPPKLLTEIFAACDRPDVVLEPMAAAFMIANFRARPLRACAHEDRSELLAAAVGRVFYCKPCGALCMALRDGVAAPLRPSAMRMMMAEIEIAEQVARAEGERRWTLDTAHTWERREGGEKLAELIEAAKAKNDEPMRDFIRDNAAVAFAPLHELAEKVVNIAQTAPLSHHEIVTAVAEIIREELRSLMRSSS